LQAVYNDPTASQGNRVKAASAAIGFEKPKLSITAYVGRQDRRTAWQVYEQWSRRRRIIMETRTRPPRGYADDLLSPDYQPPPGDAWPPVAVERDPVSGFRILSNLLPKPDRG
jgi:hypothetical protein